MESDDDMDLESEIAEMLQFETKTLASLRAGDPQLAVYNADGTLRCPLCSPSKKKQSYLYQDLLQHATAVAVGIRGPEAAGKHSALKLYLESDLKALATPSAKESRQKFQDDNEEAEIVPRRRGTDEKLVCPWSIILHRSENGGAHQPESAEGNNQQQMLPFSKNEIKAHFAEFQPEKVHMVYPADGQPSRGPVCSSIIQFGRGFGGLNDAMALDNYLRNEGRGRKDYQKNLASGNLGKCFYGWLAREGDVNEGGRIAECLKKLGDLKDVGMAGDEMRRMHEQQLRHLTETLEERNKETVSLKTEIDLLQRRAEAERQQYEESFHQPGAWTTCHIL